MRKTKIVCVVVFGLLACAAAASAQRGKHTRPRPASVCADPTVRCRTSVEFAPHQLPFMVPRNSVIFETEKFYMVVLKSARRAADDCATTIPEDERVEAQKLFPRHKVFASRCYEPEELYYEGVAPETMFMAVYAGRTRADAAGMLAKVKATGLFPGAYLKRTSTGFNGT